MFASKLRSFDLYRKLPQDIIEPTFSGATISVISSILIAMLFLTEFLQFTSLSISSEMFIDINRGGEKLQVNLDISFPKMPCDLISLDIQDVMGTHTLNIEGKLIKKRIVDGKIISEEVHSNEEHDHDHDHNDSANGEDKEHNEEYLKQRQIAIQRARKALQDNEGCDLVGFIIVNKVPGNFHVSAHPFQFVLQDILSYAGKSTLDLSHQINHLSFGNQQDLGNIMKKFAKQGILNPLDGLERIKNKELKHTGVLHQYYISVVPTTFIDVSGNQYFVHQFTANSNEVQTKHLPAVYFRYDMSPVTVKFTQEKETFFHFIVQLCAIIGGVFTIAGILDAIVHRGVNKISKKYTGSQLN